KRPFFLQGLDLFQTPIQMLYTRRIGATAPSPALPDGAILRRPPGPAPILGAAKLVANVGGIEVAAVSAVTDQVDAATEGGATPPRAAVESSRGPSALHARWVGDRHARHRAQGRRRRVSRCQRRQAVPER